MIENVLINGKGLWSEFRGRFGKGNYEKLLAPAPMKQYITNESRLEHGKRIMTNNAKTDSRDVSLVIYIEGASEDDYLNRYQSFLEELQTGRITLAVKKLKTIYHFVYNSCSPYGDYGLKMGKFTLKLTEEDVTNRNRIE